MYAGDVPLENPLHLTFLRADMAAGRIKAIKIGDAQDMPRVVAVHTGADVAGLGRLAVNEVIPLVCETPFPVLASDVIQAVGQPVAAVLADTRHAAQDAAEAIWLDVDEAALPPPEEVAAQSWTAGDVPARFAAADVIVETCVQHARLAPTPMEPRAIAVRYDPESEGVTIWTSSQTPHRARTQLARILEVDEARLHVIAPDTGGAFGMKASLYPEEVFAVWAALLHRRSVKWTATRSDEFLSATQGRGARCQGRLSVTEDGRFTALEASVEAPVGRWLPNSALVPAWNAARVLPGAYEVTDVALKTRAMACNLAPVGIYRGAGRPEANCLMERLVDKAARATGIDPIEIRKRNLLPPGELPHETATGNLLDSGDYAGALDRLCAIAGYDQALVRRDAARSEGRLSGVGIAFYVEPSGEGWESARVTWHDENHVEVASGSSSQGQARDVTLAQIAAAALEVPLEAIDVRYGDTATCPEGIGAVASRSTAIGGSAVHEACSTLRARKQAGEALPLVVETRYETKGQAWGYGCYMIEVEIDRDTGQLAIGRAVCVDDAGRVINPAQVRGQILGGFAQGLGEAMMEQVAYDEDGQLLTGSFMDYAMPRADDMPPLVIDKTETPSPLNSLGAKGVGEAGTIGAPAAILNAAVDALTPLGITDIDMPLTPGKLWQAIIAAEGKDEP